MRLDLEQLNRDFEKSAPLEIVRWATQKFAPGFAATSSFGPESGVLLSLIAKADVDIPVLFLETGFHFPETLEYKERLTKIFGLKRVLSLKADAARRAKLMKENQEKPYEANPDLCCQVNKVEPLDLALKGYRAWMSGIRRHQTDHRKAIRIVEEYEGGIYKISPLANMTSRDAWWYLKENQIPIHPLYEKGYMSIGCWPCTRPIQDGDDERSGRWAGKAKKECGIHTFKEVKTEKEELETPKDSGGDI